MQNPLSIYVVTSFCLDINISFILLLAKWTYFSSGLPADFLQLEKTALQKRISNVEIYSVIVDMYHPVEVGVENNN